jgi:hypothetical protein
MGFARFCRVLFEENVGFWVLVWWKWALVIRVLGFCLLGR